MDNISYCLCAGECGTGNKNDVIVRTCVLRGYICYVASTSALT